MAAPESVVILADESADWEIGGLRQLERLALALDEFARSISDLPKIKVIIFWRPDIAPEKRWQPSSPRLCRCEFVEGLANGTAGSLLSTHLLVKRHGIDDLFGNAGSIDLGSAAGDEAARWQTTAKQIEDRYLNLGNRSSSDRWRYLRNQPEISSAERWLLRKSGKSRDGFVSRYFNRPISRTVSRLLVRTSITPNLWTVLITAFPIVGFLFLIRGTYLGFVIGAFLFNLHSILDGCDGEIARAKYLDSQNGPGIDAIGDLISLLLFSGGLGIGLFRHVGHPVTHWFFLIEGVVTCALIAMRLVPDHVLDLLRRGPEAVVSTQGDERLRRSGGRVFGDRLMSWAFELTKRDVVFLGFLLGVSVGLARLVLHLLFVYALMALILSRQGRAARPARDAIPRTA